MATSLKKHKKLYSDVEKIKESLFDTGSNIKHLFNDTYNQSIDTIKEKSSDYKDGASNYIADHPFRSVGISLLSGVVLGFLLKIKRK